MEVAPLDLSARFYLAQLRAMLSFLSFDESHAELLHLIWADAVEVLAALHRRLCVHRMSERLKFEPLQRCGSAYPTAISLSRGNSVRTSSQGSQL